MSFAHYLSMMIYLVEIFRQWLSFLIFYYAMNPKFKVTSKEFVTDDGKKVTISTSETTVKIKRKKNNRKNKEISNNEESTSLTVADDTNKQS